MKKEIITIVFCLFIFNSFGQTIKGELINNTTGKKLFKPVTVLFKELGKAVTKEFVLVNNGMFTKKLKANYTNLEITVKSFNYYDEVYVIKNINKDETYQINISLSSYSKETIGEVIIKSRKKISVAKDTVTYNVASFKNKTDRKIQDVLKKLPGIEVEPSGVIKYRGKPIETVLLDGDNLFDRNYTIGTKNINVDAVTKIQALSHYSSNSVLHGIEHSEKTALNLILKENKTDYSGESEIGLGIDEDVTFKTDIGATLLGLNKRIKSFGLINYNNVGLSTSPFDYFYNKYNFEKIQESNYIAYEPVSINKNYFGIKKELINPNSELFLNYNLLYKLSKKTKIKLNTYYLTDKIKYFQTDNSNYYFENSEFHLLEHTNIKDIPNLYRIDLETTIQPSKLQLWINKTKLQYEDNIVDIGLLKNSSQKYENQLATKKYYFVNNLSFTKRLNENKAVRFISDISYNRIPQLFEIHELQGEKYFQKTNAERKVVDLKMSLFGINNKGYKYVVSISSLYNQNNFINNNIYHTLDTNYTKSFEINQKSAIHYKFKKWTFSPEYNFLYVHENLGEKLVNNYFFDVKFKARLKHFYAQFSVQKEKASFERLINGKLLVDYRTIINSSTSLTPKKSLNISVGYSARGSDPIYNFRINMTGAVFQGQYYSNIDIDDDFTYLSYYYYKKSHKRVGMQLFFDRYFPSVKTTLTLKSFLTIFDYFNKVNGSNYRHNTNIFMNYSVNFATGFKGLFNIGNTIIFSQSNTLNNNQSSFKNNSLENELRILLSGKKISAKIENYSYIPSLKKGTNNYNFLNTQIFFFLKKKKRLSFSIQNIFNVKTFDKISILDYGVVKNSINTLPRHFLISYTFEF